MAAEVCSVDGCDRQAVTRGWCHSHYQRWWRLGDVRPGRPLGRQVNDACSAPDCPRDAVARQLCRTHYRRWLAKGSPEPDTPVRVVAGRGFTSHGYRYVPVPLSLRHLTNGETPYQEHRIVMAQLLGRPLGAHESVHHRNGDRLDNRPENLELWSRWQPSGQRLEDKVSHALALLRRYAPELIAARAPRGRTRFCDGQLALELDCGPETEVS
jgi:hypothetical protein